MRFRQLQDAKWRQAIIIAANLTADPDNPSIPRANIEVQDIDQERSILESERQVVLHSVDQAIHCLEEQAEMTQNLAKQFEGVNPELHQDAIIAIEKWNADIVYLQLRRDEVGYTPELELSDADQGQSSSGDHLSG